MRMKIEEQTLLLDGKIYTSESLHLLKSTIGGDKDSPLIDLYSFLLHWFDGSPYITVQTSGSTGTPKALTVRKEQMMQSARLTCEYLNLSKGESVLLCMNLRYIGAMMVVVRALVAGLNLVVRPASGHPLSNIDTPLRFAAMVPLQVYNTLQEPEEKEKLIRTDILIIGGGAIDESLEEDLRKLPIAVYSTYGMTETLSHIALRRLNGDTASEYYHPFSSVRLSLSSEQTLVIEAPLVCDEILHTNDIAEINADGSFSILGRKDNVINSGGIKIQAEVLEKKLRPFISAPFVITSVPDKRLGQATVLLMECVNDILKIEQQIQSSFSPYYRPKYIWVVDEIPHTENGKTDRGSCYALAKSLLSSVNQE